MYQIQVTQAGVKLRFPTTGRYHFARMTLKAAQEEWSRVPGRDFIFSKECTTGAIARIDFDDHQGAPQTLYSQEVVYIVNEHGKTVERILPNRLPEVALETVEPASDGTD
jgi:hypothetical protein